MTIVLFVTAAIAAILFAAVVIPLAVEAVFFWIYGR